MTIQDAIDGKKWSELHDILKASVDDVSNYKKEYDNGREIRDNQVGNRETKVTSSGELEVNKIPVPFQRKVVQTASSFLFGAPVSLSLDLKSTASDQFNILRDHWKDLRLDMHLLQACEKAKSETVSAILLRVIKDGKQGEEEAQDLKLKASMLSSKNGTLYPGFNEYNDLVVFGYEFTGTDEEGNDVTYLDMYFDENVVRVFIDGTDYKEVSNLPHFFKRIPVVVFQQDEPEWEWVKALIDRYEMNLNKFADTNDYFASPFFKAKGDVNFELERDNTGQIFKLNVFETDHGNIISSDLDVVSWDSAPEAVKAELEIIKGLIYDMTDTPDLSFDNVKGLGNISGVALELMFLAPMIKAKFTEGIYRTGVSRLINILRAGMVHAMSEAQESFFLERIDVAFNSILPKNIVEIVSMLSEGTMSKPIMSQETALKRNPLVDNVAEEIVRLRKEETDELGATQV